jgi:hypothetical protein
MSPAAGGEDGGGEAWSKRGGRRGTTKLTEGGGTMVRWCEDGVATVVWLAGTDTRLRKAEEREEATTDCSSTRS